MEDDSSQWPKILLTETGTLEGEQACRGVAWGWGEGFSFGHAELKEPGRHPRGDTGQAIR